jgi:hypothetical protein
MSHSNKGRRENIVGNQNNTNGNQDRPIQDSKLATRGTHAFKGGRFSWLKMGGEAD